MLDELDDGARIGVWTALGVVAFLLFGLLGGLVIKKTHQRSALSAPTSAAVSGIRFPAPVLATAAVGAAAVALTGTAASALASAAGSDTLADVPLTGDLAGTVFFATGQAALPTDAKNSLEVIRAAAVAAPTKRVVLSGFHDATGDPAKNAELAKERAKGVREALTKAGVPAARIVLRKPESTTGEGSNQEARRVEARLVQ
jgi:outer membrane protein OmpA-like peptidoglycan-associated protein